MWSSLNMDESDGMNQETMIPQMCIDNSFYQPAGEVSVNNFNDSDEQGFSIPVDDSPTSMTGSPAPDESSDGSSGMSGGSVARRNERERKRVRMVNMGFAKLRQYVPLATQGKRLSKVETLRSAIDYIRQLRQLLLYQQQRVEDPGPVYYHIYDHPHQQHLQQQHQQQHQQQQRVYQPYAFGAQRNPGCYYDGPMPCFPDDGMVECGGGISGWSVSSESPCPSIESETTASPQCNVVMEPDNQMPCWTV